MSDMDYEGDWDADGRPSTLELLEQRKWWYPADGRRLKVKQMTPSHRTNLLAWFERRAYYLQLQEIMGVLGQKDAETAGRRWHPDNELRVLAAGASPASWLNAKPLIVRLRKLQATDDSAITPAPVVHRAHIGAGREKVWAYHSDDRLYVESHVPLGTAVHAVEVPGRISLHGPNGKVLALQAALF